jgi:hypothetical protein
MPLLFILVCGVSWLVGVGTSRLWRVGKRWEKFVVSCCLFQNVCPHLRGADVVEFVADCDCLEFGVYVG